MQEPRTETVAGRESAGSRHVQWVTFADCFTEIDWNPDLLAVLDAAAAPSGRDRSRVPGAGDGEPGRVSRP